MLPVFQGTDDGKHLLIIDFVDLLCFNHRLRSKCDWVPEAVI